MKRMVQILLFVALWLCASMPLSSWAQQASVDTTRTTLESPILLSVTLSDGDGQVDISAIEDFKVLSQGSSSSVRIVNGRVSSEKTKTYTLLPLREGRLTIPALKVTIDGETRFTEPIEIQVASSPAATNASESVQVHATISEAWPYLGQQIVYTFRLLYAVQLANLDYEPPSFEGFSATQIGEQQTAQPIIDGRRYHEVTLSYLLVPLKTGSVTIEPAQLQCDVVVSSRRSSRSQFDSFFNDPFFGSSRLETKVFRTDPLTIDVLSLPTWIGGEPFSGLVGQFGMTAELETREATVGQSVTLSVTLVGTGNIQDAEVPAIQIPDAFKQYADQPETDVRLESDGYTGSKVFRTALVPVNAGEYTLTASPLVFFDPVQKSYRQLAPPPLSLTVHPSSEPAETPTVFSSSDGTGSFVELQKQKVDFTGRDILSIKTDLDALSNRKTMSTPWFLGFLLAPGLVFLGVFCLLRAVRKDMSPAAEMTRKSRLAMKEASRIRSSDGLELLSSLYRALLYAVFARAGISGESLTSAEAETLLKQSGTDANSAAAAAALLGRLESARFGKSPLSGQQQKSLAAETRRTVKGLVR